MRKFSIAAAAILAVACAVHGTAQQQERGLWRAASNTAASITGDITIAEARLTVDFLTFPLAHIRPLKPEEVVSVFDADVNTAGEGTLYRLRVAAAQRFLRKNTLCGSDETQWMATYLSGPKTLQVAFLSGDDEPVFTMDAITKSGRLCGTYTYVR
jgi:hypothetical protein